MTKNLVRRQVLLTPAQDQELKRIAQASGMSVCRIIRHAINLHIGHNLIERKAK